MACSRPIINQETGVVEFDGKIGIFPFVQLVPAQRASRNRPRGMLVVKNVTVDANAYFDMLCNNVLPAIHAKFPNVDIQLSLQQDNASPHMDPLDETWREACETSGIDVRVFNQPANSPDLNINDLGFFRAIESIQQKHRTNDPQELIQRVEEAYADYSPVLLNRIWVTHQRCMTEILLSQGGNTYKIPHMNKEKMEKEKTLPVSLSIPLELYHSSARFIEAAKEEG